MSDRGEPTAEQTAYTFELEEFRGPLELLLHLIRIQELDISQVSIARVTDQYLVFLDQMRKQNLHIAGSYLVMAATLTQMKSRRLLPTDETTDELLLADEEERQLILQLEELEALHELAQELRNGEQQQRLIFAGPSDRWSKKPPPIEVTIEADLMDLLIAYQRVLQRREMQESVRLLIEPETLTVEASIEQMTDILNRRNSFRLSNYFATLKTRLDCVICFVALLEMLRLRKIQIRQTRLFGEITVFPGEEI